MPVVINEFEAVTEAPSEPVGEAESGKKKASDNEAIEPEDVMSALRALQIKALRAWAH